MYKIISANLVILLYLFAFSAVGQDVLMIKYYLKKNDCMRSIPIGTLVYIETTPTVITMSFPDGSVTPMKIGDYHENNSDYESFKHGVITADGNFHYIEKNFKNGAELDCLAINLIKESTSLRLEIADNGKLPGVCKLIEYKIWLGSSEN